MGLNNPGNGAPSGNLLDYFTGFAPDPNQQNLGAPQRPLPERAQGQPGRPQRLTGKSAYLQNLGPPTPVREINRYPFTVTLNYQLATAGADVLAISMPNNVRDMLWVRNSFNSAGNLFVAFGLTANDSTAYAVLVPGQFIFFDEVIPQDDVHIATDTATSYAVLGYANAT